MAASLGGLSGAQGAQMKTFAFFSHGYFICIPGECFVFVPCCFQMEVPCFSSKSPSFSFCLDSLFSVVSLYTWLTQLFQLLNNPFFFFQKTLQSVGMNWSSWENRTLRALFNKALCGMFHWGISLYDLWNSSCGIIFDVVNCTGGWTGV